MQFLGVTRNGIEINEQAFISELKSDYGGGEQGPPTDYQYLGEMHSIVAELAQWNPEVLAVLETRVNAAYALTRTKGQLLRCSGAYFRVLFLAANFGRNYTNVYINEPIAYSPVGTPATFPRITFTGLEDLTTNSSGAYINPNGSPWNGTWTVSGSVVT
jgi:hypothetical protein